MYALPTPPGEQAARAARVATLTTQQAQRAAVSEFVVRELQALLLQEDVQLVAQHVLGTLSNAVATAAVPRHTPGRAAPDAASLLPQRQGQQARRPLARSALAPKAAAAPPLLAAAAAAGGTSAAQPALPELVQKLRAAAAPFVFEHAERFAWEVAAFAAAGTATVAAYDRLSLQLDAAAAAEEGAAARRQLGEQQRQAGRRSESRSSGGAALPGSGGSSSGEEGEGAHKWQESPEAQRSDSEGYLEILLQQGAAAWRQQQPEPSPKHQQVMERGSAHEQQATGSGRACSGRREHERGATQSRSRSTGSTRGGRRRHGSDRGRSVRSSRRRQRGGGRDGDEQKSSSKRARRRRSSSSSSGGGSDGRGVASPSASGRQQFRRRRRARHNSSSSNSSKGSHLGRAAHEHAHNGVRPNPRSNAEGSGSGPNCRSGSDSAGEGSDGPAAGTEGCQGGAELAALRQQALRALQEHQQRSRRKAAGPGGSPNHHAS